MLKLAALGALGYAGYKYYEKTKRHHGKQSGNEPQITARQSPAGQSRRVPPVQPVTWPVGL